MSPILEVNNLHVSVEDQEILRGVDLSVNAGEVHAIMGPNGSGKSTLANSLAGRPEYAITAGDVRYQGDDLLALEPEDRARAGVFPRLPIPGGTPRRPRLAVPESRRGRPPYRPGRRGNERTGV